MKKLFLYIVLCLPCLLTTATAASTLDTFLQTLAAHTLHSDFVITISEGASQPMNYPGTITMRGDRFTLEMFDMEASYDGKTLYVYSATPDELTLSTPTDQELMEANPFLYAQALSKVCTITEQTTAPQALTITLTPNAQSAGIQRFTLTLSRRCGLPAAPQCATAGDAMQLPRTACGEGDSGRVSDGDAGVSPEVNKSGQALSAKSLWLPQQITIKEGKQLTTLRLTNPTYTTDIPSFTITKPDAFLNDLR